MLRHIIETDEGSCRLGEVALVSKNTPIRQSETLFFDTLYDENASCHLALGMGFPECLEGGTSLSKDDLLARGVNRAAPMWTSWSALTTSTSTACQPTAPRFPSS